MTQLGAARPQAERRRSNGRTRRLLVVDVALFLIFVLVMDVPLTGLAIHEWLGIGIALGIGLHLLQHGDWIVSIGKRFVDSTSLQNRLNYLLMLGLFVGMASIVVSGLLISKVALPWIGYVPDGSLFWLWVHLSSVGWVVALVAIHLALNWRWIVNTFERLVFAPLRKRGESG